MPVLEEVGPDNWQEYVEADCVKLLVVGMHDCDNCNRWAAELTDFLAGSGCEPYEDVRFGKVDLKQRGLTEFRKANDWLKDVHALPHNVLYRGGEIVKTWAGGGADRLTNRLSRILEAG